MIKEEKKELPKKAFVKGVTRNTRIAINTIHQAIRMVEKSGIPIEMKETESEDDFVISIRFAK